MTDRLTIQDMRSTGVCISGLREGCEARGIDYRRVRKEGMTLEEIEPHLPDAFIERALAIRAERLKT